MIKAKQVRVILENKTRLMILLSIAAFVMSGGILMSSTSDAATPAAATLDGTLPPTSANWTGDKIGPAAPNGEADCAAMPNVCDVFELTLTGSFTNKRVRVQINWALPAYDYDMYIHRGTPDGPIVATSAAGTTTFEQADIDPNSTGSNVYYVRVVYFAAPTPGGVADPNQYRGVASVVSVPAAHVPPQSACVLPQYSVHTPPCATPNDPAACNAAFRGYNTAGEPSVGVNWNTGNVLFQSGFATLRATFNDLTSPATSIWASKRPQNTVSLDPIMFTDPVTGRTIPGQLNGVQSKTAITDNDGDSFFESTTTITSGVDHQTIGGGPFSRQNAAAIARGPLTSYPHAFYYASQSIGAAFSKLSQDGGLTFGDGAGIPMYNIAQCSGLHGHVKVAPDGTVYVPNKNCPDPDINAATADGGQGVAVSENNGATWAVRTLPGSGSGDNDPAVAIGAGGRLFMAYTASDKKMRVAVSDDKGVTWKFDQDLGASTSTASGQPFNITASVFPSATAGDNNRATIFFHGTSSTDPRDPTGTDNGPTTGPDPNVTDNFAGVWYGYMATTCDGGASWSVVRVGDPVQLGVICTNGTTCPGGPPDTRNLLDFMDVVVDRFGRAVAGYADGCVTSDCRNMVNRGGDARLTKEDNDGTEVATIIRQTGGSRLFSDFDAGGPTAPRLPPPVEVAASMRGNILKWMIPDDSGSPLTNYRIYRGVGDGEPVLIGEVRAAQTTFVDRRAGRGREQVYYQVTAVNAHGESPRTLKFYVGQSMWARPEPE